MLAKDCPMPIAPSAGPRRRRAVLAALALLTAALTGATTLAPATSAAAPSSECPTAHPVEPLASGGEPVTGLTVVSGTTPTSFSGTVLGVIEGGIAPGLDMVVARLSSPEIDRVGGIWQGMSGSPVYASDGTLIGAVAYGLAWGPSPVAGITPYAEMERMLSAPDATSDPAATVAIPGTMARRLVSSGVVAPAQVDGGLERLPVPLGVSGMSQKGRLARFADALDLDGVRVHAAGAVGRTSAEVVPVVAGGNLAASISYGDLSAVGVGTATAVCGDEVLAFGHPMLFSGPSRMAMHGARAVYVQEDPVAAPFKVANPAAPSGGVVQDRLGGLLSVQDLAAVPVPTVVRSDVDVPGEWSRVDGTTHVNLPDAVPDIAAFHLLADQDRVFDSIGQGSATVGWTIDGTRADGSPFSLTRSDEFASEVDVSFEPVVDLYDQLARLHFNGVEKVSLDEIRTSSTMSRRYAAYAISRVHVWAGGRWTPLDPRQPLFVRAGRTKRFLVTLTSAELRRRFVPLSLVIPERTGRKYGLLEFVGGNAFFDGDGGDEFSEGGYLGGSAPATFDQLLRTLRTAPTNDLVMANLSLFRPSGSTIRRSARVATGRVVDGRFAVEVQGIG